MTLRSTYERFLDDLVFPYGTPAEVYLSERGIDSRIACQSFVQYHPAYGPNARPTLVFPLEGVTAGAKIGRWLFFIDELDLDENDFWSTYSEESRDGEELWSGVFLTPDALSTGRVVFVRHPLEALSLAMCGLPSVATCEYYVECMSFLPDRCKGAKMIYLAFPDTPRGDYDANTLCKLLKPTGARIDRLTPAPWGSDWTIALMNYGAKAIREELRRVMLPKHRQAASK